MAKQDETTIDKDTVKAAAEANQPEQSEPTKNPVRGGKDGEQSTTPTSDKVKAEIGGESFEVSTQEQTQLNALPTRYTATDAQGIDRVIVPTTDPWKPNPIEPDAEEVERLEQRSKALEAKRKEGLKALGVDA